MGGLVEPDRALGILAEHAIDDTDVEVELDLQIMPKMAGNTRATYVASPLGQTVSILRSHCPADPLGAHPKEEKVPCANFVS